MPKLLVVVRRPEDRARRLREPRGVPAADAEARQVHGQGRPDVLAVRPAACRTTTRSCARRRASTSSRPTTASSSASSSRNGRRRSPSSRAKTAPTISSARRPSTCSRSGASARASTRARTRSASARCKACSAGSRPGPISWLAELSVITDKEPSGDHDSYATLLEGNWRLRKGHNLKVGYEFLEPDGDRDEDQQERYSFVWEYSPDSVRAVARRRAPLQRHSEHREQQPRRAVRRATRLLLTSGLARARIAVPRCSPRWRNKHEHA